METNDMPHGGLRRGDWLTLLVGGVHGVLYFMAMRQTRDALLCSLLLPIPLYLARKNGRNAWLGYVLWSALLLTLDFGIWYFGNRLNPFYDRSRAELVFYGMLGALMVLPNFLSWTEEGRAFPEWRYTYALFSKAFFSVVVTFVFLMLLLACCLTGAALVIEAGLRLDLYKLFRIPALKEILLFAVFAVLFRWVSRQNRLLEVLNHYILMVFSWLLLPLLFFVILFVATLLAGLAGLQLHGIGSVVLLSVYLGVFFCVFAAWQSGEVRLDDGSVHARKPFARPVRFFAMAGIVLLPVLSPVMVYTIGLRVYQYGWTLDRCFSMMAAVMFGLWSLAWAAAILRKREGWALSYTRINRIAFPLIGIVLILSVSPLCDMRRVVLRLRMDRFYSMKWYVPREGMREFDWQYIGGNLGSYGMNELLFLNTAEGRAYFAERTGMDTLQVDEVSSAISGAVDRFGKRNERVTQTEAEIAAARAEELVKLKARLEALPVYGGTIDAARMEQIVRIGDRAFEKRYADADQVYRVKFDPDDFFFFEDMNGDGTPELLARIGSAHYLIGRESVYRLEEFAPTGSYSTEWPKSPGAIVSDGEHRVVPVPWKMIVIRDKALHVKPQDYSKLEFERQEAQRAIQ